MDPKTIQSLIQLASHTGGVGAGALFMWLTLRIIEAVKGARNGNGNGASHVRLGNMDPAQRDERIAEIVARVLSAENERTLVPILQQMTKAVEAQAGMNAVVLDQLRRAEMAHTQQAESMNQLVAATQILIRMRANGAAAGGLT